MKRSEFVEHLDSKIPLKGLRVLELGCGDGIFTKQLAQKAGWVEAVDARYEQIDKDRYTCEGCTNIDFRVKDVDSQEFMPYPADIVFHVGLLYHLSDPIRHLRMVCETAKRGLFLDTHYANDEDCADIYKSCVDMVPCHEKAENTSEIREGTNPISRLIPLPTIMQILTRFFTVVTIEDDRKERNGPRVTILARGRR